MKSGLIVKLSLKTYRLIFLIVSFYNFKENSYKFIKSKTYENN
ncbi:hypothetical protein SAMN06265377_3484 [Flagellimonas pacifica]|uniref:Uncharacterized protein n=1 Tax=Flagellimonas pacifica TaxID=1247520 RepID=A0A285MWS7_9FLAO|nr:hypothetical protein SAMN06265377_3484 [Allomuricauda parva]